MKNGRFKPQKSATKVGTAIIAGLVVLSLALLVTGCKTMQQTQLAAVNGYQAADFTSTHVPGLHRPDRGTGSLWTGDQHRSLAADHRAAFINDLITVEIVEDASASGSASTKTGRKSGVGMGISGLLGLEKSAARANPNMNLDTLIGAKTENEFEGSGETSRTTKVVATMTCTVVETFPNGNLLVRGKRMVKVNGEDQIITLSGIVRPLDIDAENKVVSTRIAEARITYIGAGVIGDRQNPGWMSGLLDKAWPL